MTVYGLGLEHKHVPQIEAHARLTERPIFVPAHGSYRQGIVLTVGLHARMLSSDVSSVRIHERLAERYRDAAHVRVCQCSTAASMMKLDPQVHNRSNDMSVAADCNACARILVEEGRVVGAAPPANVSPLAMTRTDAAMHVPGPM